MITASDLRATRDWQLRFPGARVLQEWDADEGEPHGFDLLQAHAFVAAYLWAPADWDRISSWYRERLERWGWSSSPMSRARDEVTAWRFKRPGRTIVLSRRSGLKGAWMPPGGAPEGGATFQYYVAGPLGRNRLSREGSGPNQAQ